MISLDSVQSAPVSVRVGAVDFVSWIARGRNRGSSDMRFLRLNRFCHISFPQLHSSYYSFRRYRECLLRLIWDSFQLKKWKGILLFLSCVLCGRPVSLSDFLGDCIILCGLCFVSIPISYPFTCSLPIFLGVCLLCLCIRVVFSFLNH